MNQKMTYIFSLVGFFLMWGVFGFIAAAPRGAPDLQATVLPAEGTPVPPEATDASGIPLTGKTEPVWTDILGFYGLIGLAALCLILALLSFANKSTSAPVKPKGPPYEETRKH